MRTTAFSLSFSFWCVSGCDSLDDMLPDPDATSIETSDEASESDLDASEDDSESVESEVDDPEGSGTSESEEPTSASEKESPGETSEASPDESTRPPGDHGDPDGVPGDPLDPADTPTREDPTVEPDDPTVEPDEPTPEPEEPKGQECADDCVETRDAEQNEDARDCTKSKEPADKCGKAICQIRGSAQWYGNRIECYRICEVPEPKPGLGELPWACYHIRNKTLADCYEKDGCSGSLGTACEAESIARRDECIEAHG